MVYNVALPVVLMKILRSCCCFSLSISLADCAGFSTIVCAEAVAGVTPEDVPEFICVNNVTGSKVYICKEN